MIALAELIINTKITDMNCSSLWILMDNDGYKHDKCIFLGTVPANTSLQPNVGLILEQCPRHRPNIKPTLIWMNCLCLLWLRQCFQIEKK